MNSGIEFILKDSKDLPPHLPEGKDLPVIHDLTESREYNNSSGIESLISHLLKEQLALR
jgi:hypothetical protein